MRKSEPPQLAQQIRATAKTRQPVEAPLKTDERVLARITDGIYRQPSSALRELISNSYDADASEVVILTDAPRFSTITVRDNGLGLSPESLQHLIEHIGGSAKRTKEGAALEVTAEHDPTRSPSGRKLIGKLGIGLFSVAQFTRHFLIITKTAGEGFRTVADITLGPVNQDDRLRNSTSVDGKIETGRASIWIESAPEDIDSQGTEVKLLDLLPRTRAELSSADLWSRIDFEIETEGKALTPVPRFHIGRISRQKGDELEIEPTLPWTEDDDPRQRFEKLVESVRALAETDKALVDLELVCDRYFQTLWTLSLAPPLQYIYEHPFSLTDQNLLFFELSNETRGQAKQFKLKRSETPRSHLGLKAPFRKKGDKFDVFVDQVQLFRPIVFRDQPKTQSAIKNPLLFLGSCKERFAKKPIELSGGPLEFEAYLFWTPKVIPTQHQGVIIRVGDASGTPFDRTFMGYQTSEQTRTRQITSEILVKEGLDGAINLDRESYNYAHPHYQFLVKWLHSAIRQLANRHKEVGSAIRQVKLTGKGQAAKKSLSVLVEERLKEHGLEDLPEVSLLGPRQESEGSLLRRKGVVALRKGKIIPASAASRYTGKELQRADFLEAKAVAIIQILHAWGVIDELSFEDQERLVHDILEVAIREIDQ
jgi:hypothetical protein